jgi:YVTN family beta-propeller protein
MHRNRKGLAVTGTLLLAACGGSDRPDSPPDAAAPTTASHAVNVYAATGANALAPAAARAPPLVYVPNSRSASVTVIDPVTYRVLRTFVTGAVPQHVVPTYDLRRLWVLNNEASSLTPIDPVTGMDGRPMHVDDPYNMYFTPDGRFALVVAERRRRLDFRDPSTMKLVESLRTDCRGIDHMEFTADGRYLVATCEFNGHLLKVDLATRQAVGYLALDSAGRDTASMPQDIRSSPDGSVFFVADMKADGVHVIDPIAFRRVGSFAPRRGRTACTPAETRSCCTPPTAGGIRSRRGRTDLGDEIGSKLVVDELPGRDVADRGNNRDQRPDAEGSAEAHDATRHVVTVGPHAKEDQQESEDHRRISDDLTPIEADPVQERQRRQHHDREDDTGDEPERQNGLSHCRSAPCARKG